MAKIYSSQNGVMSGRIGNTVYRKGQNATIASQYQPQVANPKTLGQSVQRAVFATVSQALAGMRSVVNHSHYGVSGRLQNEQRFMKQNFDLLRGLVIGNVQGSVPFEGVLNLKGTKGIQPAPYIISEGTLAFPRVEAVTPSSAKLPLNTSLDLVDSITDQADYETALRALGLLPGEQLSYIGIYDTATLTAQFEGSDGIVQNFGQVVYASRVTFVEVLPSDFDGDLVKLVSGQVYRWNPQIIARSEGKMRVTIGDTQHLVLGDARQGNDDTLACAAIVRSAKDINGRYNYSNTQMVARPASGSSFPRAINYVQSYMAGASVELGERPFLNNPLSAGSVQAQSAGTLTLTGTYDDTALPAQGTVADPLYLKVEPVQALPQQLFVQVRSLGVTKQSPNLIGATAGTVVADFGGGNTITVTEVARYADSSVNVQLGGTGEGFTFIVMGGSGVTAGGQNFTF